MHPERSRRVTGEKIVTHETAILGGGCFWCLEAVFQQVIDVFYGIHDPTTLNRQGNDVGTQYRSVIFCQSETQKQIALDYIQQLTQHKTFAQAIVTQVSDAVPFYPAEAYHQNYFVNHPHQGYCQMVVAPKVAKFKQYFKDLHR